MTIRRTTEVVATVALIAALSLTAVLQPVGADSTVLADGFSVSSVAWGTTTASASPSPGDRNVPITLTLQYYYYNSANSIKASLSMPLGFTSSDGSSVATAFKTGTTASGTVFQLTFYVNIASWVPLGTKTIPLTITWGAVLSSTQSVTITQDSVVSLALQGTPKLEFGIQQKALTPGEVNNVTLILSNRGTGSASDINTTATVTPGSLLNAIPDVSLLQTNASASALLRVFIPSSEAGAAVTFSFSTRYQDVYGNYQHSSQTLGAYVVQQAAVYRIGMSQLSSEVSLAGTTTIAFLITNTGTATIYSPTFALTTPSSLGVTINSTISEPGLALEPGQSAHYYPAIASGPTTAVGVFTGTLTVTFMDGLGVQHSQSFSPGFVVVGTIDIVIQDLAATQSSGPAVTISGTLLNEGLGSAYYLEMTGSISGGRSATQYVGELDPNTPLPFSFTIPYLSASGGSQLSLTLTASYKNNYGQSLQSRYSNQVTLPSSGNSSALAGGSSSGAANAAGSENLLRYAIIAVILIAVVASALYVRRSRRSSRGSGAKSDVI